MTRGLDLNELRNIVLKSQARHELTPSDPNRKIVVDRHARIHVGGENGAALGPVTEVNQDTFHSHDLAAAQRFLPPSTRRDMVDGFEVFTYTVDTEFGVQVILSAYFDGQFYQVKLVAPAVEKRWHHPHIAHLFADGRLCLSAYYHGGQPSLAAAYAKSVLWAQGLAAMLRGAPRFPFSLNNES